MKNPLKDCPFCGGRALADDRFVYCEDCGVMTSPGDWNLRDIRDMAKLRAAILDFVDWFEPSPASTDYHQRRYFEWKTKHREVFEILNAKL